MTSLPNGQPPATLDLSILERLRPAKDGGHSARCPICDEEGGDKAGTNLSISADGLVHCHRDKAHGFEAKKRLQGPRPERRKRKTIAATYDYCDEQGEALYQVVRYSNKDFRQRAPNGKGGYKWGLNGARQVVYHLPELLAADPAEPVFVVEGEKDVETLEKAGATATTNSGGAEKWRGEPEYSEPLRGRDVVLVPDTDEKGWAHAADVAAKLDGLAGSVRIVDLAQHWEGAPAKADVTDWVRAEKPDDPKALLLEWATEPEWETAPEPGAAADVEAFYDLDKKEFLIENAEGIWVPLNESQFKRELRFLGKSTKIPEGSKVSEAEQVIRDLIDKRTVRYAAPLAGRQAGYYRENGVRFLVTESLKLPEPEPGPAPTINALVRGLLGGGEHGERQVETLFGWLRVAIVSLRSGERQPGQALALAGPADCGKSLLQKVITELLGGRSAKAALYLTGRSNFNAQLFEAEHLMLEDESMAPDIRARRALADQIKATVVNETHTCHRKHRTEINLRPWWRLSISVNDDPEALLVLPPLDENVKDKITLLGAKKFKLPMPTGTAAEQRAFWDRLAGEVPRFTRYLLDTGTPDDLRCRRFGVATWHNPTLVADLEALAPEAHLLELIDRVIFDDPTAGEWRGTAADLQRKLLGDDASRDEARALFGKWRNACGSYLGRLAKKHPERVEQHRTESSRDWILSKPSGK